MAAIFMRKELPTVLITGANRGIGLNLAKQFHQHGFNVIGTSRNTEPAAVEELSTVAAAVLQLDVSDNASIEGLATRVRGVVDHLDVVVNNAGIFESDELGKLTPETFTRQFQINTIAPALVSQAMLPLLRASPRKESAKVIQITSRMGSIADNSSGTYYGYRASKAALNMVNKTLACDAKDVTFIALHPGYIQTRMTAGKGDMGPEECAAKLYEQIAKATIKDSGKFIHRDGFELEF
ncbi:hypothetical protein H9P43_003397 [Blastocladiella emersonii ATCC 22665]|nr:hypothetical protein H9P43_003397 [Blastocladiella emersonii ATCC 22665]